MFHSYFSLQSRDSLLVLLVKSRLFAEMLRRFAHLWPSLEMSGLVDTSWPVLQKMEQRFLGRVSLTTVNYNIATMYVSQQVNNLSP
jgi:hypothetical protein